MISPFSFIDLISLFFYFPPDDEKSQRGFKKS